jgi:hypothetical protein
MAASGGALSVMAGVGTTRGYKWTIAATLVQQFGRAHHA